MPHNDIAQLRALVHQLRSRVDGLSTRHGTPHGVRRLTNSLDRVTIDLDELDEHTVPRQREEVILVPDTPYDPALWHEADDEGVGGQRLH